MPTITGLPLASALDGSEWVSLDQLDGTTVRASAQSIADLSSATSVSTVAFPCAGAIGGHRGVRLNAGMATYADSRYVADANLVLGITQSAASGGALVQIQTGGLMTEPSWSWTVDLPVYLSATGVLTQTAPTVGFALVLGVATAATQILIGVRMPIVLN